MSFLMLTLPDTTPRGFPRTVSPYSPVYMESETYMPYSDGRRQAGQAPGPLLLNSHRSMLLLPPLDSREHS
jgi:hypothetical protein